MSPRGELLTRLKIETQALHHEIEKHVPLLRAQMTLERYRHYLAQLYGFYVPLESHLARFEKDQFMSLKERKKVDWLKADLRALPGGPASEVLPVCREHPRPETPAEAIGVLYVLEGSTLGGQVLVRSLKQNLNLDENQTRFLSAYKEQTGAMWMKFCAEAESRVAKKEHEATVRAAQQTFELLTQWLQA